MSSELASTVKRMCEALDELSRGMTAHGVEDSAGWAAQIAGTLRRAVDREEANEDTNPNLAGAMAQAQAQARVRAEGEAPVPTQARELNPNDTLDRRKLASIAEKMRRLRAGLGDGPARS